MYMVKLFFNFVFTGVLLCGGCGIGLSDRSLSYLTPEGVSILLREGAGTLLDADAEVVIVDPRPTWSYGQGHILGAINIPFGQLNAIEQKTNNKYVYDCMNELLKLQTLCMQHYQKLLCSYLN